MNRVRLKILVLQYGKLMKEIICNKFLFENYLFSFLVEGFDNEEALVESINKDMPESIFLGGVVFTSLNFESNITYKIRLSAKLRNSGSGYV